MPEVQVSLDTSVTPPVVNCNPTHVPVDRGNASINWVPAPHQSFTFDSLSKLTDPPFKLPPTISDSEITVDDDNQNKGSEIAYPYKLCVKYNNHIYCTPPPNPKTGNGSPTINNK